MFIIPNNYTFATRKSLKNNKLNKKILAKKKHALACFLSSYYFKSGPIHKGYKTASN